MQRVRVFVSFDREHDRDLRDRLIAESQRPDSRFQVAARSMAGGEEHARSAIQAADEMIVICGRHSDASVQMTGELRIAQELNKPYFLLWGRRELMCTRPLGAKPDDAMYGWSPQIIHSQIVLTLRSSQPMEVPANCKKAATTRPVVG
jgi:hypothetical protein